MLYITGIKLVNARVDLMNGFLEEVKNRQFECFMPAISVTIERNPNKTKKPSDLTAELVIRV